MLIITYLKQSMFVVVTIYDKCNTGDHEGYVEEGSGDGHLSPLGPRWGSLKGAHLPGTWKDE